MAQSFVERELKFEVEPGFVVPDLVSVLPGGGYAEHTEQQLRSDYFDTVDHALLGAQITLRRRVGGADTGWQLKVPRPPFREEIRVPLDGNHEEVPVELAELLRGTVRDRPLVPVASIVTDRTITRLLSADGRVLAEVDDDNVHASAAGDAATAASWREVEVELADDEIPLLDALGKRLRKAGARRSQSSSKLGRLIPLAEHEPALVRGRGSKLTAWDVVGGYLAEQQRVMLAGDLALRRGDADVIHKTRVATRRLRSTLRSFRPLFDRAAADALDVELRWYAGVLGEVRDRQVLQRRLDAMVAELDDDVLLGPVRARIDLELEGELAVSWQQLRDALNSDRYLTMLERVAELIDGPPSAAATKRAGRLVKRVDRTQRIVSRRLAAGNASGDVGLLHSARKAAKRSRYAAEAAAPVIGAKVAKKQAKRYQRLQDLLGEHQDSLVSSANLRRIGAKAGTVEGENGFAFGVLHEREQTRARQVRDEARRVARRYR